MSGVELRCCCDLNEGSLARIKQQFPHMQTTSRVEVVQCLPTVDGVILATIAPTHFDLARRALEAGKHVMVEKPMTLNTADAVELTRIARLRRRVLMVGHLLEYHPALLYVKHMIDSGELGEVYYVY